MPLLSPAFQHHFHHFIHFYTPPFKHKIPLGVTGEEIITSRRNSGCFSRDSFAAAGEGESSGKSLLLAHRRFPSTGEAACMHISQGVVQSRTISHGTWLVSPLGYETPSHPPIGMCMQPCDPDFVGGDEEDALCRSGSSAKRTVEVVDFRLVCICVCLAV